MGVEAPAMDEGDEVTDLWVALARDQRRHRSHLRPEPNRATIRESISQHIVTEGLLVSRAGDGGVDDGTGAVDDDPTAAADDGSTDVAHDHADTADDADTTDDADTADDPERIVGFVMFGPETGSFDLDVSRGVVENLYVLPAYRGEGRGSALLEAAETRLFERGFDRVCLDVMAGNEAARRFYARHGYAPHRVQLEKGPKNDTHSKGE